MCNFFICLYVSDSQPSTILQTINMKTNLSQVRIYNLDLLNSEINIVIK